MLQDEDYEEEMMTPERIAALGFKPQSEVIVNHLLPYAAALDDESNTFLKEVKTNLAQAVMFREMKPGCGVWSSRLMRYIRLYGLKFSKEDHITFIKLAYELLLIPDLEPTKIHKFGTMFVMLAKKRHLITPQELTLPWRPLYDLGKKLFKNNATDIGMYHYLSPNQSGKQDVDMLQMIRKFLSGSGLDDALNYFGFAEDKKQPTSLECSFVSMIKCARPYFELSATREILAEILPHINPWSSEVYMVGQLTMFLPVALPPEHAEFGHKLWFDELLDLWDTCYSAPCGANDLIVLFAGLAKRNPGAIDWSPYAPKMFSKFLSSLHLPVSYKDMHVQTKNNGLDVKYLASWIVWSINPDGVILKHLQCFLDSIESYLHSANSGRWSHRLRDFIRKISREFLNRVRRERKPKKNWENKVPESYKLRDEDITQFVEMLLNSTLQAIYNRSGSDISIALQNLATLRPALVIPPLVERLRDSLTSLTEPHKVTVGMAAVATVARALLRGPENGYPEGPTHIVPLLMAILPGLDPNDIKKTLVSLHFILIYAWMVPFVDCSSAHEHWDDLTETELLTCESTAQFEDFVLVYLDRLFVIIESSVLENVRLDTKDLEVFRSKTDAIMETAISSASMAIIMQSSPKIFKEALRKFKAFATESTFETNVSGSMVGVLLRVFARVNAEETLHAFLPQLCEELQEYLTDEALNDDNPSRDILYRLVLLGYIVECDGAVLLKYIPHVLPVLDRALKLNNKTAQTRACEVLANILQFFSIVDVKEWRTSSKNYGDAPEKWLPIREWGKGTPLKEVNLKWHIPSEGEAKCAQTIVDRYVKPAMEKLRSWSAGEISLGHQEMLRTLSIINAAMSCTHFFPTPNKKPISLIDSLVPATSLPFKTGVKFQVTIDGENARTAFARLMTAVQARMLADKSDDTKCFEALIQIWDRILIGRGTRVSVYESKLRTFTALERAMDGRGDTSKDLTSSYVRILVADAVKIADEARSDMTCESGITELALTILNSLLELSVNTYTTVRIAAQNRLTWMFTWIPFSYRLLLPKLKAILTEENGESSHEKHKGALFILMAPRNSPLINKQDWEALRELWPALLKSPLSEKQSIHRLELLMGEQIHRQLPTINTRLVISEAAVNACKPLLTADQMSDPKFTSLFNASVERETAHWDQVENHYKDLLHELVAVGRQSNIQWRRLELAMQMITTCSSLQTDYTVDVTKLCLELLIHEDITVRRTSMRLMHFILRQCKPKLKKVTVDPYEMAGCERPSKRTPGYRKDLDWAVWSQEKLPLGESEWDKPILRNSEFGFYAWPEKLVMAAPAAEQVFRSEDPATAEIESLILQFFTDDEKVTKLVAFLTTEDKKGKDKFNGLRFSVLRLLFSHFGEDVTDVFVKHANTHVATTLEPSLRFAAEVASAALRAPRYWTRQRQAQLYRQVLHLIKAGLTTITPETLDDWGTCLATGVDKLDPLRGAEFLEGLVELCVPPACSDHELDTNSSFIICARLFALQGALGTLKWRTAKLAKRILQRLDAANFIQHPFQIVRESVGSLLVTIFDTELVFPGQEYSSQDLPCLSEFLDSVMPRLAALYDENGDIVIKPATSMAVEGSSREDPKPSSPEIVSPLVGQVGGIAVEVARISPDEPVVDDTSQGGDREGMDSSSDTESATLFEPLRPSHKVVMEFRLGGDAPAPTAGDHARAANLLTTVLRTCMGITVRAMNSNLSAQYVVSGAACAVAGRGACAEELPRAAAGYLAACALAHHAAADFDRALATARTRTQDRSWWARLSCLDFAQPLLFYGLPYLCDNKERAVIAENLALELMRDPRIEVRQSAAKLLTGLMHCRALPDEDKTLRTLTRSCRSNELVERHFGVLGLCSYLSSRPYSLGPKLGDVLAELARHTNAPDPIPATIRTSLSDFRRTHQDDWQKHRDQLTEGELDLLADLTSPPSYCA